MNETLRFKEDMAHANAAINGLRVQMHWLTSERLMQRSRGVGVVAGTANGGTGGGGGPSDGGRTGGVAMMGRKLSDSMGRQDTKL